MIDYNKRLVEANEILKYFPENQFARIPSEIIQSIKINMDKEYVWNYDETKELMEQNINEDTLAILAYLNMEYILNEKQKNTLKDICKLNEQKEEDKKREKYNDDLFNKKNSNSQIDNIPQNEYPLMVVKDNFFTRLIKKIKSIFNK